MTISGHRVLPCLQALVLGMAMTANAIAGPSHSCEEPSKPNKFKSQQQIDAFMQQAEAYMDCLKTFYAEQSKLSKTHAQAANGARDEMKSFAAKMKD